MSQMVRNLPAMQKTHVRFLGWDDPLEKELTAHSSVLAWKKSMDCRELDTTERLSLTFTYGRISLD